MENLIVDHTVNELQSLMKKKKSQQLSIWQLYFNYTMSIGGNNIPSISITHKYI